MLFPELECAGMLDDHASNHGTQELISSGRINTEFQKGFKGERWKRISKTAHNKSGLAVEH